MIEEANASVNADLLLKLAIEVDSNLNIGLIGLSRNAGSTCFFSVAHGNELGGKRRERERDREVARDSYQNPAISFYCITVFLYGIRMI